MEYPVLIYRLHLYFHFYATSCEIVDMLFRIIERGEAQGL